MGTEAKELDQKLGSFDTENIFGGTNPFDTESFIDAQEDDHQLDLESYDGVTKEVEEPAQEEIQTGKEEDMDLFKEDDDIDDEVKLDLENFNKKFNKNFQTEEELKAFIEGKEVEDNSKNDDTILEEAEIQLSILLPLLELGPEDLMRKQFETIALQEKKDLNDEDVKIEIEEKIQDLIDSRTLNLEYRDLKRQLDGIVQKAESNKTAIIQKREQLEQEKIKSEKEQIQKELINFHGMKSFYGVKLDKETVANVYKKISNGKFIENLQTDKKAMAELALMAEVKEIIFKKSSGLTYNDGIASILNEFKAKEKANPIVKAQSRGTAASAEGQNGLINAILMDKKKEENK